MRTTWARPFPPVWQQGGNTMNTPKKTFRAGAISATIWNNTADKNGETVEYSTVTFERSYKDDSGDWKTTNSLRVNDLPKASLVLQKAYEHLALAEQV